MYIHVPCDNWHNNVNYEENISSSRSLCNGVRQLITQRGHVGAKLITMEERLRIGQSKGPQTLSDSNQGRTRAEEEEFTIIVRMYT